MTIQLLDEIRTLSEIKLKAQEIKGTNALNPIHTTAGMHGKDILDKELDFLISELHAVTKRLIEQQGRMQRHAYEVNCRIKDVLKFNKNMKSLEGDKTNA